MKLASLKDHSRDGDNMRYAEVASGPTTLQMALDHWDEVSPKLLALYDDLSSHRVKGSSLDQAQLLAPLPRAYEWIDASAYINHVILVRKARKAEPPATLRSDPLIYQGGSGVMLSSRAPICLADEAWGLDFESEVAVVLGDTPQGTKKHEAHKFIKLVVILNDVSLRNLIPQELEKGFGFFQSKPATAFAPFAVTPDELGVAWQNGRLHLPLISVYNGKKFGDPNAGPEMHFSFFELIEHVCKTRSYTAGTILGSGTVSNEDRARGSSCLAERRMIETIDSGKASTPFMAVGDTIEIEMFAGDGQSIFGKISQRVEAKNS
ncbi:MAG: fumarylacetoacetate hydrolase family protein [Proteobacteria bacterium]|nr:fumarylacetoacetate hydrolase family protein [Pseudomonadota bacterium]